MHELSGKSACGGGGIKGSGLEYAWRCPRHEAWQCNLCCRALREQGNTEECAIILVLPM